MNKRLLICFFAIVIIAIGAVVANTQGFNKGFEYGECTRILVYMNSVSNLNDIKQIVDDVVETKYDVAYTDEFSDTVSIRIQDISEEKIDELKNKLIEKYNFKDDDEFMVVLNTPSVRTYDLIKEYFLPVGLSFVLVLVYLFFANRKLGAVEALFIPAVSIVIINALYVSVIAICRISINSITVPFGVIVYIVSLLGITMYLNNKNKAEV